MASMRPAIKAVKENNVDILQEIIEASPDLNNEKDYNGWTLLHYACEAKNIDIITFLLENGFDVNALDNFQQPPLAISTTKGHLDGVRLLLENNADVSLGLPIHKAAERGHKDCIVEVLSKGANVNAADDQERTPLIIAAAKNQVHVVEELLKFNPDLNAQDDYGCTPLHYAAEIGCPEIVRLIIGAGVDCLLKSKYKMDPFHSLLVNEHSADVTKEILELLLQIQPEFVLDKFGTSLLHYTQQPEVTEFLIERGIDVNLASATDNETALWISVFNKDYDNAKVLIKHGADVNLAIEHRWTPLHICAKHGNVEFLEYLIENGANVNAVSPLSVTPLYVAAAEGHLEVVKSLVKHGAIVDVALNCVGDLPIPETNYMSGSIVTIGYTPVLIASAKGHRKIVEFLLPQAADLEDISPPSLEALMQSSAEDQSGDAPQDLFRIVKENNLAALDQCISEGKDVNVTDFINWTPLHYAVDKLHVECVSKLIKAGANVNIQDIYNRTPLSIAASGDLNVLQMLAGAGADVNLGLAMHYAVAKGEQSCVIELLELGASLEIEDKLKRTPLLLCTNDEIAKILLENGANTNHQDIWQTTLLHKAATEGDADLVTILLDSDAHIDAKNDFSETPLIFASNHDRLEAVKVLLERGADVNAIDLSLWSPLHYAVFGENLKMVQEILKRNPDLNIDNNGGQTPLHLAADNLAILGALLEANAEMDRLSRGWAVLHISAYIGRLECVRELLAKGANPNVANCENVTPLYIAAAVNNFDVLKVLVENGADLDVVINDISAVLTDIPAFRPMIELTAGNTPFIAAASEGYLTVIEYLHEHGASINNQNGNGNTALHEAVLGNHKDVIEFLIGIPCDMTIRNNNEQTALEIAKSQDFDEIVTLLESAS